MISLADDLKSAATDALKKAATLLGVGLHLYNDKGGDNRPRDQKGQVKVGFEPVEGCPDTYKPQYEVNSETIPHANSNNGNRNGNGYRNRQLSLKQYDYIRSLGKKIGYDYTQLTHKCIEIFGVKVEVLSTAEASSFIEHLQTGVLPPAVAAEASPQHVNA